MKYELKDEDYLKLYMYFQDKAINVKGAMFNTITWVIGFAAALLGFVFAKLTSYDALEASVSLPIIMKLISGAGIVICLFAFLAIRESAKHIRSNWDQANRCCNEIEGMKVLLGIDRNIEDDFKTRKKKSRMIQIWNQLNIVVLLFLTAFFGIFIWSFCF